MSLGRKERLHELHLALEGAVDQLGAAHRIAVGGPHGIDALEAQLPRLLTELVALRNSVRDELMRELAKPPAPPTIRKGK